MATETVNFDMDTDDNASDNVANEIVNKVTGKKSENGQSNDNDSDFNPRTIEQTDNDTSSDRSAYVLYEDDNFLFTSEGIVDKKSVSPSKDNSSDAEPDGKDEKILGKFNSYDDLIKSYKELEKKMGESSDAVNKLRELNPVLPILEAMLGDENLLGVVEDYFTNPQAQSEALKKQLGIDDNFVFDLNEALSNPKSEDAKVLNKLMQVRNPKPASPKQSQTQADTKQAEEFMKKQNLSQEEFDSMMQQAQSYKLTYDDIYLIMNKDKILADAQKKGQSAVKKQVEVAQTIRKSRSGGGEQPKVSPEDAFINAIAAGGGLFD